MLDRRRIAAAALDLADQQGTLTIPALARALGVAPSALYHHVSGRDEIISLMREELIITTSCDRDWSQPWPQALDKWTRGYLAAFTAHPRAVPLLATTPLAEPCIHAVYEEVAELLLTSGFAKDQIMPMITALESFTLGSALDSIAPPVMVSDVAREKAPHLAIALDHTPTDQQRAQAAFDTGLQALLTGFAALLPDHHTP
ncbi:hypothetical protein AQJ67_05095 [Streptomyces caeruleatus]|uniref:HTH tetR-type domain-containing protein n=1 Tax=Streptomyces caeruleatus TaxID=661399 RepID=A0A101U7J2_9ACTN|nr:hypothetical protein AQJ67_05095 [Streptomyces caeruleatus]